ncbi:uncharacterized protein RAG0_04378 [Rhynchosporium agropyri]|uniref:Uncharacterized protein n=1 Tax=Rhynchosporium agropyri TaxID=914238 RepID=A0A1E1K8G1_9HELO|nr:uncharacterized protein RAG0_04378 [Rhynchosporium agropyri]
MVAFRGLSWANKTPSNRLGRSDLSVTTPSSPAEIEVPSVQDLVGQLETQEDEYRRRSSVGDKPTTTTFHAQPFRPLIPYSRTPSPRTLRKVETLSKGLSAVPEEADRGLKARSTSSDLEFKVVPLVFTTVEGEVVQHPYFLLATPSGASEESGSESNSYISSRPLDEVANQSNFDSENLPPLPESPFPFSPSTRTGTGAPHYGTEELSPLASPFAPIKPIAPLSPLNLAVDSATDPTQNPLPESRPGVTDEQISETPSSFYYLDPSSAMTFDTSVRDLIQEAPDVPIGGKPAGTMIDMDIKTRSPRSKSPKPKKKKRSLHSRSTNSDTLPGSSVKVQKSPLSPEPFANLENMAQLSPRPATPMSEASMKMVTAPGTPFFRRRDVSDMSEIFDGPGSVTTIKDFGAKTETTDNAGDICSDSDHNIGNPVTIPLPSSSGASPSALPTPSISGQHPLASKSMLDGLPATGASPRTLPAFPVSSDGLPLTEIAPDSVPTGDISAPGAILGSGLPDLGTQKFEVPSSKLSRGLAVPADITGKVDPPALPTPSVKRQALGKGKRKGQKVVRKGRSLILRKSVLSLVIGRQLAGTTATALKLVSQGTSVDPGALKDAGTAPLKAAPVPASPPPVPGAPLPA